MASWVKPIKGATITVTSCFSGGSDLFGTLSAEEIFTSDENGYYQIRFIKRTHNDKVAKYYFRPDIEHDLYSYPSIKSLSVEDIKKEKFIIIDTVKITLK